MVVGYLIRHQPWLVQQLVGLLHNSVLIQPITKELISCTLLMGPGNPGGLPLLLNEPVFA